jgi:hypothetical protein
MNAAEVQADRYGSCQQLAQTVEASANTKGLRRRRFHSYFFALVKTLIRNQIHRCPCNRSNGIANALSKSLWNGLSADRRTSPRCGAVVLRVARRCEKFTSKQGATLSPLARVPGTVEEIHYDGKQCQTFLSSPAALYPELWAARQHTWRENRRNSLCSKL